MRQINFGEKGSVKITDKQAQAIKIYLDEIDKIPLLEDHELIALCQRKDAGDKEALDAIVKANLRLVVSIAKSYQYMGLPFGDVIDEGNEGLIKAAKKYDITKGITFSSHATTYIRGAILSALSEYSSMVRIPPNRRNELNKVKRATLNLLKINEYEPSLEEVLDYMEKHHIEQRDNLAFTIKDLKLIQDIGFGLIHDSLSSPIDSHGHSNDEGGSTELGSLIAAERENENILNNIEREEKQYFVATLLHNLDEKARDILKNEYEIGEFLTIDQIKEKYGFKSTERIRQIREESIKKLQKFVPIGRGRNHTRHMYIEDPKAFMKNTPMSEEEWKAKNKPEKELSRYKQKKLLEQKKKELESL